MRKLLLCSLLLLLVTVAQLPATPVLCTTLATLQDYLNADSGGGCYVQDKLFTNFTYSGGGVSASNVAVTATLSLLPGIDIHGFTFVPKTVWTSAFKLDYDISVIPPSPEVIVSALDQYNVGPGANAATLSSTKSNGVVFNLTSANATESAAFSPLTTLHSSVSATIPANAFIISLEEQYEQEVMTAEPVTLLLIGSGLAALGILRRRITV